MIDFDEIYRLLRKRADLLGRIERLRTNRVPRRQRELQADLLQATIKKIENAVSEVIKEPEN